MTPSLTSPRRAGAGATRQRHLGRAFLSACLLPLALLSTPLGAAPPKPVSPAPVAAKPATAQEPLVLQIVGGLASLNQYTRHEVPFWSQDLAKLSGGRYRADIVPFDKAGLRGPDMLSLVKHGSVPFGTVLLSTASLQDPELAGPDLAGMNPDAAALQRTVAAWRPVLESTLRERHGVELLALYTYPAQVLFCKDAWRSLADLKGRRIRISSRTQGDWVEALGAQPVTTGFAEILANVRSGNIDCAITGTMSGNTIGFHEVTSHVHGMALNWGLSVFVANTTVWRGLPEDLRALLRRELPRVERAIWDESIRETAEGLACNTGTGSCTNGRRGGMNLVAVTAEDLARSREVFDRLVLPRWKQRCGPTCENLWDRVGAGASAAAKRKP